MKKSLFSFSSLFFLFLYLECAEYYLILNFFKGTSIHAFAHSVLTISWNLMCRVNNAVGICLEHLEWRDDALCVYFSHMKNDQTAERPRDPRHVYANPIHPEICPVLSLGIYLLCFKPNSEVFNLYPGKSQADRYGSILREMLQSQQRSDLEFRGINPSDIGTHSIRKGSATYASSGSTSGPSSQAIHLRAGWTLGNVQDTYMRYDSAGDQHTGRVVCGLPQGSPEFAMLPPYFIDEQLTVVVECMEKCFPSIPVSLKRVALFALASVIYHSNFLSETLVKEHVLFLTPLYTGGYVTTLASQIKCHVTSISSPICATGIPAYAGLSIQLHEVHEALQALRRDVQQVTPETIIGFNTIIEQNAITAGTVTSQQVYTQVLSCLADTGLLDAIRNGKSGKHSNEQASTESNHTQGMLL
jgi:hypothetical protein